MFLGGREWNKLLMVGLRRVTLLVVGRRTAGCRPELPEVAGALMVLLLAETR